MKSFLWKLLLVIMFAVGSTALLGQSSVRFKTFQHMFNASLSADRIENHLGPVVLYRGKVAIETPDVVIRADELDFDSTTLQADLRGAVTVRFKATPPPPASSR